MEWPGFSVSAFALVRNFRRNFRLDLPSLQPGQGCHTLSFPCHPSIASMKGLHNDAVAQDLIVQSPFHLILFFVFFCQNLITSIVVMNEIQY